MAQVWRWWFCAGQTESTYGTGVVFMFQLVARNGKIQGLAWPITDDPMIIGRSSACAIQVKDPVVSRNHCRLYMQEDELVLHDMDSRNATLVNGTPVKHASLTPGDEIAIGEAVFMVTRLQRPQDSPPPTMTMSGRGETSSLKIVAPIYSQESGDSLFSKGTPHTTKELVHLFAMGRDFSQAKSVSGLITMLLQHLVEQFRVSTVWVVLNNAEAAPLVLPVSRAQMLRRDALVWAPVQQALQDKRSFLFPQRELKDGVESIRTTIVSPILLGQDILGALVAQTRSPDQFFEESDLEYLIAHAYAVAPYIKAVERLEQLEVENQRLVAGVAYEGPIVGNSAALAAVRAQARDAARSKLSVLILGETGTGKELVARMIHDLSDLADKPLVVVNCAAIPDELFESEVFGHERGAFTGAHAAKKGLIEECAGGTLFLDEIGDLSTANQARLLRAIETGAYRRLGGNNMLYTSVRVLAATNKDLEVEIQQHRFRRDLYHRLNTFIVQLPPLRERRDDIPALVEHFRRIAVKRDGCGPLGFTPEALRALERHSWPGNVRELRNIIERAMVVARADYVCEENLGLPLATAPDPPFSSLEEMERHHIEAALRRSEGNVKSAAALLGIGRSTLYRKINERNIVP